VRHAVAAGIAAALALAPAAARALVWPDVVERIERDLQAADAATRRNAARELAELGPGRGGPLAVQALGDPDDEVKLAAAEAAIRLHAADATDVVATWLNAPDARLRHKACDVARALPNPRVVGPLARTLGDPDAEVRSAAAEALGRQASADAVPPLLGRLDDGSPAVRVHIVAALGRLGDPRAVVPLVGKVQDSSPEVREGVVRALGDLDDKRASPALVLALRDQNTDVRRDALGALGQLRATDAIDAITPFVTDRTPALRLAALSALGRIASPDALRVLVQALGTGDAGGPLDRSPVNDALVAGGPASIPPLHALLAGSPSPAAASSAAWVLGALHATTEGPAIVAAMRRGTLPPAAALHALVGAGTPAEVPVVLEFVADPSPVVRQEALDAAAALLDPRQPDGRAVEPLAAALRDARPSAAERTKMAALLGHTGAARAAPVLVELTRAHDADLRLAAIDALGTLGPDPLDRATGTGPAEGTGADDALLEALASADPTVRLHAAVALEDAGGPRAREDLLARLDGGDEVDRAAVLTALGGVLARVPSDAAIARLAAALAIAAGPERDAILDAVGRAPSPAAVKVLAAAARSAEPTDRREVAVVLAAHPGDAVATATARALLGDGDAGVRAQAAWALGTLGDPSDEARLAALAAGADVDAAADAAAALGRIAARAHAVDLATRALCPLEGDRRAAVRANALAGLALSGTRARARCDGGAAERRALSDDPSDEVRAAAARAIAATGATKAASAPPTPARAPGLAAAPGPGDDDARALERCARSDPSGGVAAACRAAPARPERTRALLVYGVADGATTPRPGASYALRLADGLLRGGTTDRRGAVFEPAAPEGDVTLGAPTALIR
jgi:HEAT repeat protein